MKKKKIKDEYKRPLITTYNNAVVVRTRNNRIVLKKRDAGDGIFIHLVSFDPDNISKASVMYNTHKNKLRHNSIAFKEETLDFLCEAWLRYKKRQKTEVWTYAKELLEDATMKYMAVEAISKTYTYKAKK